MVDGYFEGYFDGAPAFRAAGVAGPAGPALDPPVAVAARLGTRLTFAGDASFLAAYRGGVANPVPAATDYSADLAEWTKRAYGPHLAALVDQLRNNLTKLRERVRRAHEDYGAARQLGRYLEIDPASIYGKPGMWPRPYEAWRDAGIPVTARQLEERREPSYDSVLMVVRKAIKDIANGRKKAAGAMAESEWFGRLDLFALAYLSARGALQDCADIAHHNPAVAVILGKILGFDPALINPDLATRARLNPPFRPAIDLLRKALREALIRALQGPSPELVVVATWQNAGKIETITVDAGFWSPKMHSVRRDHIVIGRSPGIRLENPQIRRAADVGCLSARPDAKNAAGVQGARKPRARDAVAEDICVKNIKIIIAVKHKYWQEYNSINYTKIANIITDEYPEMGYSFQTLRQIVRGSYGPLDKFPEFQAQLRAKR